MAPVAPVRMWSGGVGCNRSHNRACDRAHGRLEAHKQACEQDQRRAEQHILNTGLSANHERHDTRRSAADE